MEETIVEGNGKLSGLEQMICDDNKTGDSLFTIAQICNTTVNASIAVNPSITNPSLSSQVRLFIIQDLSRIAVLDQVRTFL